MRLSLVFLMLLVPGVAHAEAPENREPVRSDLFPGAGHPTLAAATGLPFLGIGEIGIGVSKNFAIGVVGGITPSVVTAGLRPRVRLATSEHTSFTLIAPMLYYPSASAPGPGNVGTSSWLLARPELLWGGDLGERWTLAGGMGVIAAGSTEALGQCFSGHKFEMPAYDGSPEAKKGFAGGIWNTVSMRSSYRLGVSSHLFAEASVVMAGVKPADNVGGPPIVVELGYQVSF